MSTRLLTPVDSPRRSLKAVLRRIDLFDDDVAARVIAIQHAAYQVEADLIGFDGIPPLQESIDDIRRHDLQWLGSWDDGLLVGILAWSLTGDQCEIDRLAVHPDFFRRGHGRSLVLSLADHRIGVVSTGTENAPARRLYESLGFVPADGREIAPGVTVTELRRFRDDLPEAD